MYVCQCMYIGQCFNMCVSFVFQCLGVWDLDVRGVHKVRDTLFIFCQYSRNTSLITKPHRYAVSKSKSSYIT